MNSLEARFDAVQEQILSLYEKGSTDLSDQILYWSLVRKEGALEVVARRNGLNRLGLHTVPSQVGAEHKAKSAILMHLQLSSLKTSKYGSEPWTMPETSIEMYERTEPSGTFKKHGLEAEVLYDCNEDNAVSYMVWGSIYKQEEDGRWYKYASNVDYYGVYYTDHHGNRVYYEDFDKDSDRYGRLKEWTVNFKTSTFTSCPDSSTKETCTSTPCPTKRRREHDSTDSGPAKKTLRRSPSPTSPIKAGFGRRQRQGEPRTGRGRPDPEQAGVSPEEVGRRLQRSPRHGGGRLENLLADARDPPIILVKGPPNSLKCWRNRVRRRFPRPFSQISTVFSWVDERDSVGATYAQLLVAFTDLHQRTVFLESVTVPKGALVYKGSLDGL